MTTRNLPRWSSIGSVERLGLALWQQHSVKTVRILQGRFSLAGEQSKLSDATIGVILAVSGSSQVAGEYEAAKDHVESLQKIIELSNVVHIQGTIPDSSSGSSGQSTKTGQSHLSNH